MILIFLVLFCIFHVSYNEYVLFFRYPNYSTGFYSFYVSVDDNP